MPERTQITKPSAISIDALRPCCDCDTVPAPVRLKNGEVEASYCEGCFAIALLDLLMNNDYLIFASRTALYRGQRIVEVRNGK